MGIELYKKAFEIRESQLWNILTGEQVFALKKKSKGVVYVQVTRNAEGHKAVCVLYGEESFDMLRRLFDDDPKNMADDEEALHLEAMIEGVQLLYFDEEMLDDSRIRYIRSRAEVCGADLDGRDAYPVFYSIHPGEPRTTSLDKTDVTLLDMALDALLYLIKDHDESIRPFIPAMANTAYDMMMLEKKKDDYKQYILPVPALEKIRYPAGSSCNEILQKRLKTMKKKGNWVCRLKRMTEAIEWGQTGKQVAASYLDTIDPAAHKSISVTPVAFYEKRTEVVLDKFMEAIVEYGSCPAKISVMDERTYRLLKQWCKNCGIKLELEEYIPELDLPEELLDMCLDGNFDPDLLIQNELASMEKTLDLFLAMPDEELHDIRDELKLLKEIRKEDDGFMFPEEIRRKFDKLIKRMKELGI